MSFFKKELLDRWEELPPLFLTSSEKKKGRDSILDFIDSTNAVWHKSREESEEQEEQTETLENQSPIP